jgi:glycosyltransferase involved in cell wall biosynthesis
LEKTVSGLFDMKSPFFSIIIPTFNSAETLVDCFQSIYAQEFNDYEVLVVDGISTDNTASIIELYANQIEHLNWVSEKDAGVYDAMNKGIKMAKGQWLYFLGSDDQLYDAQVLSDVANYLKTKPKCEIIYGNAYFLKSKIVWHGLFNISLLLLERNICHQAIFYKATIFEKLGNYNLSYKIYSDWDFNIRCFMHTSISIEYIDRIIANYQDGSGMSHNTSDSEFHKLIPVYYICQLNALNAELESIKKSKALRLGIVLIKPFNFFRSLLKS